MDNQEEIKRLMSELVLALPGYRPLETPSESTGGAIRFALASMYKEKAYRDYLERAIRLNVERFQDVRDMYGLGVQQGRVLILKELLNLSEQMFTQSEKIEKSLENLTD